MQTGRMFFILFWTGFIFQPAAVFGSENQKKIPIVAGLPNDNEILRFSPAWLNELEESYRIGFAKQFRSIQYRNRSTPINSNIPASQESWCRNVTFLSVEQNKRLIHKYGYNSVLNSTINEMLENPRAWLFNQEDHSGNMEDYKYSNRLRRGMCSDIEKLEGRVKSVLTFGKCIRLFEKQYCRGWSLAVYPGGSNSHRLELPRHVTMKAIGPCLKDEFSAASLNKTIPSFLVKDPQLRSFTPDLIRMFNPDVILGKRRRFHRIVVQNFLGQRQRPEIIEADFSAFRTVSGENVVGFADLYKSIKSNGDVLGFAIPKYLDGPTNEAFNIFPANITSLIKWNKILLKKFRIRGGYSRVIWQFEYENEITTRPLLFYYWIYRLQRDGIIEYGRIDNGHQRKLRRDRPFSQVLPKYEYLGNTRMNLTEVLMHHRISQIIESFSGNESKRNFNQQAETPLPSLRRCKHLSIIDQHLKENTTETSQFTSMTAFIQVQCRLTPRIKLNRKVKTSLLTISNIGTFSSIYDFAYGIQSWDFEDYHFGKAHKYNGCYNIIPKSYKYIWEIKSATTFLKCIRLFEDLQCLGLSLAIYGTSGNSYQEIDRFLPSVKSVGPCLEDEFNNASFNGKEQVVKNPDSRTQFPDLVQFSPFSRSDQIWVKTNDLCTSEASKNYSRTLHSFY